MEVAKIADVAISLDSSKAEPLHFTHFPLFAKFLLEEELDNYSRQSLDLARAIDFPLLRYLDFMPEEQLIEASKKNNRIFLTHVIENRLEEFLDIAIKKWKADQAPLISRDQVESEDITLGSYLTKTVLAHFIPKYTNDVNLTLSLISEIDKYILKREYYAIKAFVEIQRGQLKEANKDLQKSEAKLLEAQEIAGMGSFEWSLTEKDSSFTPQLLKIFGLAEATELPLFLENVHPADRARVAEAVETSIKECGEFDCQYRYLLNGDEKIIWAKGVVTGENGRAIFMRGTVMDITEKSKIKERIRRNETQFQELVKEVEDYAIILLSPEGDIMNWNLGAEKINGYKAEEIIGENFKVFYSEEDRSSGAPQKFMEEAYEQGRATREGLRTRKDGTTFWAYVVLTALHDEQNQVAGFLKVSRDLTKIKQAEEQMQKYSTRLEVKNKELEQTNKELESFSYVASHDLQEPLRNIKIFSNLILGSDSNQLSEKGKQLFSRIIAASNRMQKLIDDLLAFSHLQMNTGQLEPVDLNIVVNEIVNGYADAIHEKRVVIATEKLPVIKGVAFQFRQLFENLISNSIKYAKNGIIPEIRITCDVINGKLIENFDANAGIDYYKIAVTDNGIGFEPKYAFKIFEVFQRLHGKDEYSGTGIGLAICKKIVQNHQGFIYATSEANIGSTFFICLPCSKL
jgi:PAS domain S-box-containing protein